MKLFCDSETLFSFFKPFKIFIYTHCSLMAWNALLSQYVFSETKSAFTYTCEIPAELMKIASV